MTTGHRAFGFGPGRARPARSASRAFGFGPGGARPSRNAGGSAIALAVFLAAAGANHFAQPRFYDRIVPRSLPGSPRAWTYASGVAEIAVAAAVAHPRTRRAGGLAAAALFAAVFPANVKMAVDWRRRPARQRALAYGRLPLQAPLIWWALRVRATAPRRPA